MIFPRLCVTILVILVVWFFFFQAEDGIRDLTVTGVQTCALPIWRARWRVRPLPRAARGGRPVEPYPPAGARPAPGRARERGRPPRDPAFQIARHERHGGDDLPLQAGDGRGEGAGGGGLRWDREPQ